MEIVTPERTHTALRTYRLNFGAGRKGALTSCVNNCSGSAIYWLELANYPLGIFCKKCRATMEETWDGAKA